MKALFVVVILCWMAARGLGQQPPGKEPCLESTHAHKHSDLRVALIEINDVDRCGFSYVDLEARTIGQGQHVGFSRKFSLARNVVSKDDPTEILNIMKPNKDVRKGLRGTMLYCVVCKTAFVLKRLKDSNH